MYMPHKISTSGFLFIESIIMLLDNQKCKFCVNHSPPQETLKAQGWEGEILF